MMQQLVLLCKPPAITPDYYIVPGRDLRSDEIRKVVCGTIERCRRCIGKTSQSIATTGKFFTRNWESEQSQTASSNVPKFESESVRVHGKSCPVRLKKVADGFTWAEGPVWNRTGHYLLFSDVPNNGIIRWKAETN